MGKNSRTCLLGLSLWLAASGAFACSTPVFRYAIERWEAESYRLIIFTNGELTEEQRQTIQDFHKYERYGYQQPPLTVQQVAVPFAAGLSATVWAAISTNHPAPAVALLYPSIMNDNSVVWTDELSSNALNRIVMSPVRLETATRLLGGDAAVWLLVKGDDPEENRATRELLDKKLKELEKSIVYNADFVQLAEASGDELPPLHFSVLEVDPDDPREEVLMAMLTRLSPEAQECAGPVVIPVFGQGRAAFLMMNESIADESIEQVAGFLTGACSCEVKSLNPGFDILIPVDWIGGITEEYVFDEELPPLTTPSIALPTPSEPGATPEEQIEMEQESESHLLSDVLGISMLIVLGTLGLTTWFVMRKKQI